MRINKNKIEDSDMFKEGTESFSMDMIILYMFIPPG